MAIVMVFAVGNITSFAAENTEADNRERPADAKLVEVIELEIDENGNIANYTSTNDSGISPYSHTGPMSITLSPSGNWVSGKWREFDGQYIGYDVSATYSDGRKSDIRGLIVYMEAYTSIGNNPLHNYMIPLNGVTYKCDDWRRILGAPSYRFMYKNTTYDLSGYEGSITVKIQAYSWS